jgi:hypothetical protein
MSEHEVAVLGAKLDSVLEAVGELKEQNKVFSDKMYTLDTRVSLLSAEHCRIQEQKKEAKRPWYNIVPSIIQGLIIALLIYVLALK